MSSTATLNNRRKRKHMEVIPENVQSDDHVRSFGDETPSNETAEQDDNTNIGSEDTRDKPYQKKPRKKRGRAWQYLEEVVEGGQKFARCRLCQISLKVNKTASTTTLNRHVDKCKAMHGLAKQTQLQLQTSETSSEVILASFKYDHAEMRRTISHYILINELPFIHVESFMFNEVMRKATPHWQKISRTTVMDPRFKMKLPTFCFPTLYPMEGESERNLAYLTNMLNDLYQEYVIEDRTKRNDIHESSQTSCSDSYIGVDQTQTLQGINDYESFIRESGAILEPVKSELDEYLGEKIVIPSSKSFDALGWWKMNNGKYPILSCMARDTLSIPISTVASESTFSAGGRVIEPHRSCLKPETVEMLLCGADWACELYGLKKQYQKNILKEVEIDLTIP